MIVRARTVVTMQGGPIENGAVAVHGNRITAVGPWPELHALPDEEVVDLGDSALLPGLINAHCHLDYTMLRGLIPAQTSFTKWIRAINDRKASVTPDDYVRSIEAGLAEAAKFGTATIANLEAFPELVGRMATPRLRIWWFAEMIDVRAPVDVSAVYRTLESPLDKEDTIGGRGLAPHAPYTASKTLYADTATSARELKLPATTHLAESTEEMQMFREGRGPLFDFMKGIGRPMDDCGNATPLALMIRREVLDERWLVAHLNELTPEDFELLRNAPRFHIVHCPRSHAYFRHAPFPLHKLRALGFNLCLGTDSLASNHDLSLFAEMRELRTNQPTLSADEILRMVTVNPAVALGQHQLGQIGAGYQADFVAVPFQGNVRDVTEEILTFAGAVPWLMVNGKVVRD